MSQEILRYLASGHAPAIPEHQNLQAVPATIRIVQTNDNNRSDGNFVNQKDAKISDDDEKQYVERAIQFCEDYERDLHLIRNNCWSFAFDLFQNISSPEETVSLL